MDPQLKAAVLGADAIQAPSSSLGADAGAQLAALYQSSFRLPQSSGAVAAGAQIASDKVDEQKRAAAAAKQKERDMADPENYRRVKKDDGGYDFFAPDGSQIDIATLTERTGTRPTDWIDDSENPIDIQYREDSKNLEDYINAVLTRDNKKLEAYRKSRPELSQYDDRGGVDRLINDFKQSYQRYYQPKQWGAAPGRAVVPTATTGSSYGLDDGGGI